MSVVDVGVQPARVVATLHVGDIMPTALVIPEEAVVRVDGETGVFVLERGRVRWRLVTIGARRSGKVLVEEGLAEDELVVIDPPGSMQDEDRVQTAQ